VVREKPSGQLRAFLGETEDNPKSLDEFLTPDSVGEALDRTLTASVRQTPFAKIEQQIQSIAKRLREFEKSVRGIQAVI
jgi:hypothetical protein